MSARYLYYVKNVNGSRRTVDIFMCEVNYSSRYKECELLHCKSISCVLIFLKGMNNKENMRVYESLYI